MKENIHYLAEISSQIDAIPDDSILSLTLGKEQQITAPGTWVYLPARLPYSIVAESKLIMVLYLPAGCTAATRRDPCGY
jgi:hypothetical protein